jgi:hypothetical protein
VGNSWKEQPPDASEPDEPNRRAPAAPTWAAARRDTPAVDPPSATPPQETRAAPDEPTSPPSEQLSWVYRRGADVWIYRREGAASLEGTATQVARLIDEIRAVPPAGETLDGSAAPTPASGILSRSFLIGLLTGVLLAVLLVIVFNWLFASSLQSMLGFTGAALGMVSIRRAPVPKDRTARLQPRY